MCVLKCFLDFGGLGKQSAPSRAVVMRSSLSLPALAIDGPSNVEVDAEEELMVSAVADFSACASAQTLLFSWSQAHDGAPAVEFQSRGRLLIIPPGTMRAGKVYRFQVSGFPKDDPQNRGSAYVTVRTILPPLPITETKR